MSIKESEKKLKNIVDIPGKGSYTVYKQNEGVE